MRHLHKPLLTIGILAIAFAGQAQYAGATVAYVKVKPGQESRYLELEKEAKLLHQARVDKGIITEWQLYKKLYTGANDPYEYILVHHNDDFSKTENAMPWELITSIYSNAEIEAFQKKAGETRTMVKREYYDRVLTTEGGSRAKYIRINRYNVMGNFVQLRRDYTKPIFQELVNQGHLAGWSLWHKTPSDKKYQYVSVDGFSEFGQWKSGLPMQEAREKALPGTSMDEIGPKLNETKDLYQSEYWELVDFASSDSVE